MDKKLIARLAAIESSDADGRRGILFVHEEEGLFREARTNRTYKAETLQALYKDHDGVLIINHSRGAPDVPPHPCSNPRNLTLNDVRLYNEIVIARDNGAVLTPEQEAYLATWAAEDEKHEVAYEAWETATQAHFDEQVRRIEGLGEAERARRSKR